MVRNKALEIDAALATPFAHGTFVAASPRYL
jgi:hypothetical protein